MKELLAARFLQRDRSWVDLATGELVRVHVRPAGSRMEQFAWSDRCATLSRLRHPLLNELLDYGVADSVSCFEAWRVAPPLRASGAAAVRMVRHAARLLESHGMPLAPGDAGRALRQVRHGPTPRGRPVGVVLQPRRAAEIIADVLSHAAPGGVTAIGVRADVGAGLRTLWVSAARMARLEGYMPLAAHMLRRIDGVGELVAGRHVALFADGGAGAPDPVRLAETIVELGLGSARRHLLFTFGRDRIAGQRGIELDRMGVSAMHGMIYRDSEEGPTLDDIDAAVRLADGFPGALIDRLRGYCVERPPVAIALVHESSPVYAGPGAAPHGSPLRRGSAALHNASTRAAALAHRGRHAAAIRLLRRAARVRELQGNNTAAAEHGIALGFLLRDRGRSAEALAACEHARVIAGNSAAGLRATIAVGVVHTDEGRFADAEALLRSARLAAEITGDAANVRAALLALARCLLWQERGRDAGALIAPLLQEDDVEAWSLAARIHAALDRLPEAADAASRATAAALEAGDPRSIARAARASTVVRAAIGDFAGAEDAAALGLRAAALAHLPLLAIRIRAALRGRTRAGMRPVRLRARRPPRRPLPLVLRRQLEPASGLAGASLQRAAMAHGTASIAELREFLEITQRAEDDDAGLQALADIVLRRLNVVSVAVVSAPDGREAARAGRAWPGIATIALRAMAAGSVVSTDMPPVECAAPVRFGGETIGAVACRWAAGVPIDAPDGSAVCAAAALAAAASLRAVADRAAPPGHDATSDDLLGTSPQATQLRHAIVSAARAPFPVLILGESGSGKELVARAIHRLGSRRHRRLCTINCAALSDDLVEAELFGHSRGAFTGAMAERAGLFEEADGGTLFLDEVGELSGRAQAKLLRVLQDGEVRRVGENLPRRVDTRVVAATNRCLEREVEAGRFRADLRFRLDVIRVMVPPLRERATDIPALVAHFWHDAAARVGSRATLAPDTVAALTRYDWPGNVRELQNAVAAMAVHGPRRGRITPGALPQQLARHASVRAPSFEAAREEFERRYVRDALAQAGGQRTRAARALGVSRQGLAKMLRRLQIEPIEGASV